jgi:hypothetical protein
LLLLDGESDVTLHGFNQVEKSICVEHVMLALEEDFAHVFEVGQKVSLLGLLGVEVLHKLEDGLRSLEGILPDFHVEGVFELLGSELEELYNAIFVIKFDRVGNLVRLNRVGLLLLLKDLTVMVVKGFTKSGELLAALESLAEFKEMDSHSVVDPKSLGVVTEGVEDDLADISVEVNLGEEVVLLVDKVHVAIGNQNQLFRSGVRFLDSLVFFTVVEVTDHTLELLGSGFCDELFQKDLVFLLEVIKTLLKKSVTGVLADVSEMSY